MNEHNRDACIFAIMAVLQVLAIACSEPNEDEPGTMMAGAGGAQSQAGAGGIGGIAGNAGAGGAAGTVSTSGGAGGTSGAGGMTGQASQDAGMDSGSDDASVDDAAMPDDAGPPSACNTAFIAADTCNPEIVFDNDEAAGDGAMFDQVIPDPIATMKDVICQICTTLYRDPSEVPRDPETVHLRIYDFDGVANAGGSDINFSSRHIANYDDPQDARFEYIGVLVHEATHLYQANNDGDGALIEGMADFVRIRAGHHRMDRRDVGGAWTDAYTTSGFFFSWLAGPGGLQTDGRVPSDPDIGWAINQQINGDWSEQVFIDRLGVDVDTLWEEYQDAIR